MGANAASLPQDSIDRVMFDFFCLIRICGFRVAEYAQTMQTKVDYHEYPSGKRIIKAFLSTDWVFRDKNNRTIKPGQHTKSSFGKVPYNYVPYSKEQAKWAKNHSRCRQRAPRICPVRAALCIAERASRINLDSVSEPLAVYITKSSEKKYLTMAKIADILQAVAAFTHPDLTPDEIK